MLHHKVYLNTAPSEWVIFIHGAGGSSAIWFKQLRVFREDFHVLLIDLRGHGGSRHVDQSGERYSLQTVSDDILAVMDHRGIDSAHFVGVSLGTILMRFMLEMNPDRIRTQVMAGAITSLNPMARILILIGNGLKRVVPFRMLYASFAWIIMPGPKAREARRVFRREARKVTPLEFGRWLTLTSEVRSKLASWRKEGGSRPILYAMGSHDYLFLPTARNLAQAFPNVELAVIEGSGHVCNLEKPDQFNQVATRFILEHAGDSERT